MTRPIAICALLIILLSGCSTPWSESRLNPSTWPETEEEREPLVPPQAAAEVDRRPLIPQIVDLQFDRTTGGIILRATGLAPSQGYSQADLVPITEDIEVVDGTITLAFRALPPPRDMGGERINREVVAARFLSNIELNDVRSIRVVSQSNMRRVTP